MNDWRAVELWWKDWEQRSFGKRLTGEQHSVGVKVKRAVFLWKSSGVLRANIPARSLESTLAWKRVGRSRLNVDHGLRG